MEAGKNNITYRIQWISNILKYGLLLHGIRNTIAKLGIDIMPYYWEIGFTNIEPQQIRDDVSKYQLSVFNEKELTYAQSNIIGIDHKDLISDLKYGDTCLGIKKEERIAIYSFIRHKDFNFRGRQFSIGPHDGYVHNTYTFEEFRGLNLAPYLRYRSYEYFKKKGINTYYSISEYFNKPTLKYKRKLGIKPLKLYLSLILFNRWTFNFELKSYKPENTK